MQIIFYPMVFLSVIGHFFLGYILTKKSYYSLPVGLLFSASIVSILSRLVPIYTIEIIVIILLLSTLVFFFKKFYIPVLNEFNIKKFFYFFTIFVIFGLVFIKFHYQFLIYQSHESFYFAPSIELYLSDYYGNLKSLTYFPSYLTGHPIYPSSVLSAMTVFVNDINLVKILEARYMLIIIFFSIISIFYLTGEKKINFLHILSFILILYFYDNLISHSLLHSDIIGLFCFAFLIISIIENTDNSIRAGSYLSLFLLLTKPGIIFIFLIFPAYFYFYFKSVRQDIFFYIISFLIFLNCFSWIALETPFGNSKISFLDPLDLRDYFYTLISASWFNNSLFFDYLNSIPLNEVYSLSSKGSVLNFEQKLQFLKENILKITIDSLEILFNLIITFGFSFYLVLKSSIIKNKKIFNIFLIISFIFFLFLRNENIFGNKSMEQTVHIVHFLSILPLILLSFHIVNNFKKKYLLSTLILIFFINFNFDVFFGDKEFNNRINSKEFVKFKDLNYSVTNISSNFYKINDKKIFNINDLRTEELKALLYGKRILRDEYDNFSADIRPHIITWSYPRLHNYYWSNSYINDHSSNKILNINILENKLNW